MGKWKNDNETENFERVEGEIVDDGGTESVKNVTDTEKPKKKEGLIAKGKKLAKKGYSKLKSAPTWAKVMVAGIGGAGIGAAAGMAFGKLGTEDDELVIPDFEELHELHDLHDLHDLHEIPVQDEADEIAAATTRLADAVEQIVAPVVTETEGMVDVVE